MVLDIYIIIKFENITSFYENSIYFIKCLNKGIVTYSANLALVKSEATLSHLIKDNVHYLFDNLI